MKLKILEQVVTKLIIPWLVFAAYLLVNDHYISCMLVIFLPAAIVAGIIIAFKHEVWKAKHPPR